MNLILTHDCNKGCPYCFARSTRNSLTNEDDVHMSMDFIMESLDKSKGNIKLLGGEPTQHPQFSEIVDEVIRRKRSFTLISNFLFDENTLEKILDVIDKGNIGFLVNATDLDKGSRMETWSRNYNEIYKKLYSKNKEEKLSAGLTISDDFSTDYYVKYINYLLNNVFTIERMRLSLSFPGNNEGKDEFNFINNKELGKKILVVIRYLLDKSIPFSIDCTLYPCLFNNREEWKFIRKFEEKKMISSNCSEKGGLPADIFPDKTVSYCYPLKDSIKVSSEKYNNFEEIKKDMKSRYRILVSKIEAPEACQNCSHFKTDFCEGPCLGFYDLSKEEIGKNL